MPHTYQSIIIDAPLDAIWSKVQDFHHMPWAAEVLSCAPVGDKAGTEVGAQRLLNGAFLETLTHHDAHSHALSYSIDDGPSPVSPQEVQHYLGAIRLRPITEGGGTFVEWSSRWESTSDAAVEFCSTIYVALLKALADSFTRA